MVSIAESMQGMCGDNFTTISKEEQLRHEQYAQKLDKGLNADFELDREATLAKMKKDLHAGFEKMKESDFAHNNMVPLYGDSTKATNGKSFSTEDFFNIVEITNNLQSKIISLEVKVRQLENNLRLLSRPDKPKPGFFRRIYTWMCRRRHPPRREADANIPQ